MFEINLCGHKIMYHLNSWAFIFYNESALKHVTQRLKCVLTFNGMHLEIYFKALSIPRCMSLESTGNSYDQQ